MYTHGSRIWFQVAKRSHSSRYLTWRRPPDSTVCAIKTWRGRDGSGDKDRDRGLKETRGKERKEMMEERSGGRDEMRWDRRLKERKLNSCRGKMQITTDSKL